MARFDVVQRDEFGRACNIRPGLEAGGPAEALLMAREAMSAAPSKVPDDDHSYAVYRRRRVRRRKLVAVFLGPDGDDGTAGVREPRRPRPTPPSLRAHADLPAYRDW